MLRVSYEDLRTSLEQFGVYYTDEEFRRLIPYADKEGEGCVPFLRFAKCLRWPSGLEKIVAKRNGQDQWEGVYGNLGQGLQVLLEETGRTGKRQMKEVEDQYHLVNVITGDPLVKQGSPLVPPREMLCLSYLEQLSEEENTKREMTFKSFMPADPPGIATRTLPILKPAVTKPTPEQPPRDEKSPEDQTTVVTLPPVVPAPTIDAAAAAAAAPRKSVTLSPKKSVVAPPAEIVPPQAPGAPDATAAGGEGGEQIPKPEDPFKLPVLARKSMAPPGGFDSMPTFETMKQATRTKRLHLPSYSKRLRQERRNQEIQAVQYLA
ncbi:zonadhesin-like [Selaginella moellendorffii]|uniref:zonadhesin-like n=1 Tax=Selaginella moellendorffii TaxID=88036 RepID=UPI000D1C43C6|nr:zonadhesin-like [Selaginella moellendorffii]|eukprot:XP_024529368.1 zonadhesin-like [Selaginella moellendorffii]